MTTTPSLCDQYLVPTGFRITEKDVAGQCQQKCAFLYQYEDADMSSWTAQIVAAPTPHLRIRLPLSPANARFNDQPYVASEIRVYRPSVHRYAEGQRADAELVLVHHSVMGHPPLHVCMPIASGSTTASFLDDTVAHFARRAGPDGGAEQVAATTEPKTLAPLMAGFRAAPFYTYTGTWPCEIQTTTHFIVYTPTEGSLRTGAMAGLAKILPAAAFPEPVVGNAAKTARLFRNKHGARTMREADAEANEGVEMECTYDAVMMEGVEGAGDVVQRDKGSKSEGLGVDTTTLAVIAVGFFVLLGAAKVLDVVRKQTVKK